jgi:hypothetical protein
VSSPEIIKETPVEDGSSTDDNSPILVSFKTFSYRMNEFYLL